MRHTELKPNLLVVAVGKPAIVLSVQSEAKVEVQIIYSKRRLIVDVDDLEFFPTHPGSCEDVVDECQPLPSDEGISLEALHVASERFLTIEKYLAGHIDFKQALELTKTKKSAFYSLLGRFDPKIGASSLYPRRSGREKYYKTISIEAEHIIRDAIDKEYKGKAASFVKVWEEVQAQCTKLKIAIPSQGTVTSRIKELGQRTLCFLKDGAEVANQKFGAKPGSLELAYPLQRVEIDHTLVDCILVDEETRKPLFRPWLTLVMDVYSRVILGYYIGFNPPSGLTVACAITHATLPKKRYLENLGCSHITHPFFGVPEVLHMDNAAEFRSVKLQRACSLHGIITEWRPLGRKHYGGHIERLIGTMMTSKVHFLRGTTMSNVIAKGNYDSEDQAALTIGEFTKWFAGEVEIYNYKIHSALKCSPADKWNKAFTASPMLTSNQKLITDPFTFRLDFMPEDRRKIHPNGIRKFNHVYWAPELRHHVGLRNVTIKYDPFTLYMIWAKIDGSYIELRLSDLTHDTFSYEEYLVANKHAALARSKEMPINVIVARDENEKILNDSAKATNRSRKKSKAAEAYATHTLNQLFESAEPKRSAVAKTNIDFSKAPAIYDSEDL
ncbi:Mu transposase C-terminal domain-containing protein [Pseudomonas sp. O230]|uniref:Mu transposase C-terminal domain-containing protein n=1 Tax=Pseudomonas sp. O230 TaxID=3159450 RepID=UPI00387A9146